MDCAPMPHWHWRALSSKEAVTASMIATTLLPMTIASNLQNPLSTSNNLKSPLTATILQGPLSVWQSLRLVRPLSRHKLQEETVTMTIRPKWTTRKHQECYLERCLVRLSMQASATHGRTLKPTLKKRINKPCFKPLLEMLSLKKMKRSMRRKSIKSLSARS